MSIFYTRSVLCHPNLQTSATVEADIKYYLTTLDKVQGYIYSTRLLSPKIRIFVADLFFLQSYPIFLMFSLFSLLLFSFSRFPPLFTFSKRLDFSPVFFLRILLPLPVYAKMGRLYIYTPGQVLSPEGVKEDKAAFVDIMADRVARAVMKKADAGCVEGREEDK